MRAVPLASLFMAYLFARRAVLGHGVGAESDFDAAWVRTSLRPFLPLPLADEAIPAFVLVWDLVVETIV